MGEWGWGKGGRILKPLPFRGGADPTKGVDTMAIETKPWDAADVLQTPADIAAYLDTYLEDGTPGEVLRAINTVIRSRGLLAPVVSSGLR